MGSANNPIVFASQVTLVEAKEEEITTILEITQDNNPTTAPWREITLEEGAQDLTVVQKIQYTACHIKSETTVCEPDHVHCYI